MQVGPEDAAGNPVAGLQQVMMIAMTPTARPMSDEAMALLIFGKPASQLGASELVQVAQAMAELAGQSPGEGVLSRLEAEGKPANIIENILKGQIGKFFAESCFLEQGFVKDPDIKITALLEAKGKELGDTLTVTRFVRFGLGE